MPQAVADNKRIRTRYLSTSFLKVIQKMPKQLYLLYAILRIIFQVIQLIYVFLSEHYDYILVQNPPCVPILFVLSLLKATRLSKSEIIIDWHNYGYSILRVNHVNKFLVALAKLYELLFSKCADYHLCVSRAMQTDLQYKFGVKPLPHVLYDKATRKFRTTPLSIQEIHDVLTRAKLLDSSSDGDTTTTLLTKVSRDG